MKGQTAQHCLYAQLGIMLNDMYKLQEHKTEGAVSIRTANERTYGSQSP